MVTWQTSMFVGEKVFVVGVRKMRSCFFFTRNDLQNKECLQTSTRTSVNRNRNTHIHTHIHIQSQRHTVTTSVDLSCFRTLTSCGEVDLSGVVCKISASFLINIKISCVVKRSFMSWLRCGSKLTNICSSGMRRYCRSSYSTKTESKDIA